MFRIYLDYNATTPIATEVAAVIREQLDNAFGNPSSTHWAGAPARRLVEEARSHIDAVVAALNRVLLPRKTPCNSCQDSAHRDEVQQVHDDKEEFPGAELE